MGDNTIVVVAASFAPMFPARIYSQLKKQLKPGQDLVKITTGGLPALEQQSLTRVLTTSDPLALIGICIRPDAALIAAYKAANVPMVLIDEEVNGASTVTSDHFMGGYMAGDYLARKGRKRIGLVSGKMGRKGDFNAVQRMRGFEKALAANGQKLVDGGIVEVIDYSYNEGAQSMEKLLEKKVDAVFSSAGDVCALGLLKGAWEHGIRVPEEIAIVGYDDIDEVAANCNPPLTTIRQPITDMALAAYRIASNENRAVHSKPQRVLFHPELVVRASA